jgi:erythromycin esterase-like protein
MTQLPAIHQLSAIQRSRVLFLLLLAMLTVGCAAPRERPVTQGGFQTGSDAASSTPLDSLIRDVCDKAVVMLGEESHHGGGHTLEVKSDLVQRLIERCGFDAVYFESDAYEFVDLNRRLAAGTSAPEQVADAIGGLWSVSSAIDPLVGYLYTEASAGRVRLAGLDPQLTHASSGYLKATLPGELVLGLSEPRRSTCAEIITRHTNWRYDSEHPYDSAARDGLAECFREASDAAPADSALSVLARATLAILTNPPAGGPGWDARERQMAQLFRWHQRLSKRPSRVIVWTANVHAARYSEAVNGPVRPFGDELHAEYGDRLVSIAFTALGGAYGRNATLIPTAASESLESRAMADGPDPLRYLPRASLAELGDVDASVFNFDKTRRADWSLLFDGAVVLREEKPLSIDRSPKPRFVPGDRVPPG